MTHPEDLLAGYVDDTLQLGERVAVDAHLSTCDRCRREVALATAARRAMVALGEVPAPAGVASRALEEAGAGGERTQRGPAMPRAYRFAAVAAAAAAVALILVLVLPRPQGEGGGGENRAAAPTDALAPGTFAGLGAHAVEIQATDYDPATLEALADQTRKMAKLASPTAAEAADTLFGSAGQTDRALACLQSGAPDAGNGLFRLIQARFQGAPAYIAVFVQGARANRPADKVTVWVVARRGCRILSFVQASI
jgi:anti-sigma factor RsiW